MSDVMLFGVLRMPPRLWSDSALDVAQRHARYLQAADELERLQAEVERLRGVAEECAKVCEDHAGPGGRAMSPGEAFGAMDCAAAIRERFKA